MKPKNPISVIRKPDKINEEYSKLVGELGAMQIETMNMDDTSDMIDNRLKAIDERVDEIKIRIKELNAEMKESQRKEEADKKALEETSA